MKKIVSILMLLISVNCFAQLDESQIMENQRAIVNAGDSVGMYALIDGKYILMEPLNFSGTKVNALGAVLTYGLAPTKLKYTYKGSTSPYQFDGEARFQARFGIVSLAKTMKYYMFSSSYSIRDFSIAKMEVKKKNRLLVGASVGVLTGTTFGIDEDENLQVEIKPVQEGVYDIIVKGDPGEYCFVFSAYGTGVYNSIFDFTIK